jgi:hypothetical protein
VIQALRTATDRIDFFNASPHNELLLQREANEAYCRAVPGNEYLVYFPDSGEVELDISKSGPRLEVDQLHILTNQWSRVKVNRLDGLLLLQSPGKHFIFLVQDLSGKHRQSN